MKTFCLLLLICSIIDIGIAKPSKHFLIETNDPADMNGSGDAKMGHNRMMINNTIPDVPAGEDSCPGSQSRAASGVNVFCLNQAGKISCSSNRDCPSTFTVDHTCVGPPANITRNEYVFLCESNECQEYDEECHINEKSGPQCPLVAHVNTKPLVSSTAVGEQTLSSQKLAQRSGCPSTRPCRYRSGNTVRCGRLIGLGSLGRVAACPRKCEGCRRRG